ncbi:MAG: hypothetical protein GWO24_32890, partial [Akkermansiaceae bacterium]|nr:hypothetical protein [Akkermansiaceae bacterium]
MEQVWFGLEKNLNNSQAALSLVQRVLATLPEPGTGASPVEIRRHKHWLQHQETSERNLGNEEKADALVPEILKIPVRPDLSPRLVDLSDHYNGSLYDGREWSISSSFTPDFLAESFAPTKGVEFDLRGLILLTSGEIQSG